MASHGAGLPVPRLLALGTASPQHDLEQGEVAERAARIFAGMSGGFHRLMPVYRNAAIAHRQSTMPIEWYEAEHGFAERNELFLEQATALLQVAAGKALAAAGLRPEDIDGLVTVTSSGIATPSLDARLMQLMGFRPETMRLPMVGLGCAGGVLGLARTAAMARAMPEARLLFLVVELCGLTFRRQDHSKSNLVATALFGDGAAAAVISARADNGSNFPSFGACGEHTWPNSLDVMGWQVANDGLQVMFSRDIPHLVRNDLRPVVDAFLDREGLNMAAIDGFVCHPGGAKVLDALEACFDLVPGSMKPARQVLHDHGNMSAVTLLFVLQAAIAAGGKGRQLLLALGPGFTAGMQLLDLP